MHLLLQQTDHCKQSPRQQGPREWSWAQRRRKPDHSERFRRSAGVQRWQPEDNTAAPSNHGKGDKKEELSEPSISEKERRKAVRKQKIREQ